MSATLPTAIPTPAEFPVQWESPEDAMLFWQQDSMHFPDPVTAMEYAGMEGATARGFTAAVSAFEAPVVGMRMKRVNGYAYQAIVPFLGSPEDLEARGRQR